MDKIARTRQPPPGTRHSETICRPSFLYNGADKDIAIVGGRADSIYGTEKYVTTKEGVSFDFDGASGLRWDRSIVGTNPSEATIFALINFTTVLDNQTIISLSKQGDSAPLFRLLSSVPGSANYAMFQVRGATTYANITNTGHVLSGFHLITGVFRDGSREKSVFVNNAKIAISTTDVGTINLDTTTIGYLDRGSGGTGLATYGEIPTAGIINRALSDAEVAAFSRNIWATFSRKLGTKAIYLGSADTIAPIISNATGSATGSTTATGTFDTDETAGTGYAWATTNATELDTDIIANDNNAAVTSTTTTITHSGLTASTTYYIHYVQNDAAGNTSNVISSASFVTDAASTFQAAWATRARASRMIGAR